MTTNNSNNTSSRNTPKKREILATSLLLSAAATAKDALLHTFSVAAATVLTKKFKNLSSVSYKPFGKFKEVKGSGLHYLNPFCETMTFVDRKENFIDLKQQSIMTKDNVNILIDAVVYYQIEEPYKALFKVQQVFQAIAEISKTTLRDIFGHVTLQEALETKEKMAQLIRELIDKPTEDWGVNVNRVLIQEIIFSKDLQDNLSAAATAKRIAEGKIIQAQADVDSAKLLREASDILNTQAAMQIRYLDAITGLARANNTKIIFMPSDASRK